MRGLLVHVLASAGGGTLRRRQGAPGHGPLQSPRQTRDNPWNLGVSRGGAGGVVRVRAARRAAEARSVAEPQARRRRPGLVVALLLRQGALAQPRGGEPPAG